jgi:hypothetical protein
MEPSDDKDDVLGAMVMVYVVLLYSNALRANEGFKMDLGGL